MKNTRTIPFKENRHHGTQNYPCAFYQIDDSFFPASSQFELKHHWHEELEIVHFESGSFQFDCNMQKYEITTESFCFIGSGDLHLIAAQGAFTEQALVFSPSILSFAENDPAQQHIIGPLYGHTLTLPLIITAEHACFETIRNEFSRIRTVFNESVQTADFFDQYFLDDPASCLLLKASLCNILAALSRSRLLVPDSDYEQPDRRITAIKRALSYMKEHYTEKIYIRDIAAEVNMNEQYFCRFFKKIIGSSPIEYLSEMRIKNACQLLKNTELSVMDVCLECGFNNLGNFMKAFRKCTGCTPLQYKKSK